MAKIKKSLREICREVGVPHLQVTEVFRRIEDCVINDDVEVITHGVGTFYKKFKKRTTRVLNGVTHEVPPREQVALRGARFPGREEPEVSYRVRFMWDISLREQRMPRDFSWAFTHEIGGEQVEVCRVAFNASTVPERVVPGGGNFLPGDELTLRVSSENQSIFLMDVSFNGESKSASRNLDGLELNFAINSGNGFSSGQDIPLEIRLRQPAQNGLNLHSIGFLQVASQQANLDENGVARFID